MKFQNFERERELKEANSLNYDMQMKSSNIKKEKKIVIKAQLEVLNFIGTTFEYLSGSQQVVFIAMRNEMGNRHQKFNTDDEMMSTFILLYTHLIFLLYFYFFFALDFKALAMKEYKLMSRKEMATRAWEWNEN